MDRHDLTRMLIESTVSRTLNQMRRDPNRSVRNLVDLGVTFSKGRFQKTFLELTQTMLENQQSAYYDLLDRLVQQVSHETLKTFGVNLGYEGLTRGAETIRSIEAIGSYNIPWMLAMDCGSGGLDICTLRDIIRQGIGQGVRAYSLMGADVELPVVQELCEAFPLCAFLLWTGGDALLEQGLESLSDCHNLFVALEIDTTAAETELEAAEALAAGGLFYGICRRYTDETCIAPAVLERYLDYHPAAVILLPGVPAAFSLSQVLYQQIKALRMAQKYPYFLLEGIQDSLYVDRIISGDGCLLYIHGDGRALGVDQNGDRPAGNILDAPLVGLLRQALPKAQPERREG